MAKSSRGGKTVYEKQQSIIDQFERINRQARYEEKYGKQNLSITEKLILEAQQRRDKLANQPKVEEKRFSPKHAYNFVYGNKLNK
jgi:hypothetical protein